MKNRILSLLIWASIPSAWAQSEVKTSVFGDVRVREESIESENVAGKDNYDQLRIRARLGVKAAISDYLSSEFRLATGSGGTSTNQSFTGGSRNYNFLLDRAYFKYTEAEKFVLRAGRTDNPFILAGDNNLLFDGDLNFDGASAMYSLKNESFGIQFVLAHTVLVEGNTSSPPTDSVMNSAEVAFKMSAGEMHTFLLTLSEHAITNTKNRAAISSFSGNSNNGSVYLYDYEVTAVGFEYGLKTALPMVFFLEYANNNRTSKNDSASVVGFKINKLKKKGDWLVFIDSRELGKDSFLGSLTESDSFGGGTNGRSLNISAGYSLDDNANLMATYFSGETFIASGETSAARNRLQLDVNVKF